MKPHTATNTTLWHHTSVVWDTQEIRPNKKPLLLAALNEETNSYLTVAQAQGCLSSANKKFVHKTHHTTKILTSRLYYFV